MNVDESNFVAVCVVGNIVLELSKDKHNASLLDRQLVQFQSSVNRVESELSSQIRYLTQVKDTPHPPKCPIQGSHRGCVFHRCMML